MAAIATVNEEARKTARHKVLDTGLMRFRDFSVPCVIRNLSDAGAALDAVPHGFVPNQFTLTLFEKRKSIPAPLSGEKERASASRSADR